MTSSKSQNVIRNPTQYFSEVMSRFVTYCEQQEQSTDDLIDQLDPENNLVIEKNVFIQRVCSLGIKFDENDFDEILFVIGTNEFEKINMNYFFDEVNRMNYAISDKKYKTTYF